MTGQGSVPAPAGTQPGTTSTRSSDGDGDSDRGTTPTTVEVAGGVAPKGTTREGSIRTPDGRDRTFHVYVPSTISEERAVPLLVALHGGTGWGLQFERNSGFDDLAEANRFIVVYPDGIGVGANEAAVRTWNGGYCCGPAMNEGVDDVAFISMLIDEIASSYSIDADRVYAAGHSNGGILAYRLACELSDKIVAVGLQAGSLGVDKCAPERPVSLLHIHGTADQNHPVEGGRGTKGISGVTFRPAIAGVETLARVDDCPRDATNRVTGPLQIMTWTPCRDGAEVQFVQVTGASHAWMGHPGFAAAEPLVGKPFTGYDSSLAIWTFLANHPRR